MSCGTKHQNEWYHQQIKTTKAIYKNFGKTKIKQRLSPSSSGVSSCKIPTLYLPECTCITQQERKQL